MSNKSHSLQAYRFRDAIALNTPGVTLYLSPLDAEHLAEQLRYYADSVRTEFFVDSHPMPLPKAVHAYENSGQAEAHAVGQLMDEARQLKLDVEQEPTALSDTPQRDVCDTRSQTHKPDPAFAPGSFGCHEALHMAGYFADQVNEALVVHPAIQDNVEWSAMAEEACDLLHDLYIAIGTVHLDAEDRTPERVKLSDLPKDLLGNPEITPDRVSTRLREINKKLAKDPDAFDPDTSLILSTKHLGNDWIYSEDAARYGAFGVRHSPSWAVPVKPVSERPLSMPMSVHAALNYAKLMDAKWVQFSPKALVDDYAAEVGHLYLYDDKEG